MFYLFKFFFQSDKWHITKVLGKLYETSKCVSHLRLLISKVTNEIEKIFLICPKQVVKFLLVPSMVTLNTFLLTEKVLTIIQTNYVNTAFTRRQSQPSKKLYEIRPKWLRQEIRLNTLSKSSWKYFDLITFNRFFFLKYLLMPCYNRNSSINSSVIFIYTFFTRLPTFNVRIFHINQYSKCITMTHKYFDAHM